MASSSGTGHDTAAKLREELMRCGALAISDRVDGCIPKTAALHIREIAYRSCWPADAAEEDTLPADLPVAAPAPEFGTQRPEKSEHTELPIAAPDHAAVIMAVLLLGVSTTSRYPPDPRFQNALDSLAALLVERQQADAEIARLRVIVRESARREARYLIEDAEFRQQAEERGERDKAEIERLREIADDALALLDQHISDEQRRELARRIIERMVALDSQVGGTERTLGGESSVEPAPRPTADCRCIQSMQGCPAHDPRERDGRQIAQLTEALRLISCLPTSAHPIDRAPAIARAVLADEEDT